MMERRVQWLNQNLESVSDSVLEALNATVQHYLIEIIKGFHELCN